MVVPTRPCQESIGPRLLGERSHANKQTSVGLYTSWLNTRPRRRPIQLLCSPVAWSEGRPDSSPSYFSVTRFFSVALFLETRWWGGTLVQLQFKMIVDRLPAF
jgi:hypothetical protein